MGTTDGRSLERTVVDPHGTPADPCSFDEVAAKFSKLAALVKKPEAIERIRSAARDLASTRLLDAFSGSLREGNLRATESAPAVMQNA